MAVTDILSVFKCMMVGEFSRCCISERILNHTSWHAASVATMYYAYAIVNAMVFCFFEDQEIGLYPKQNK